MTGPNKPTPAGDRSEQHRPRVEWSDVVGRNRTLLKRLVARRLSRLIAPRIDASDVVQETFASAVREEQRIQQLDDSEVDRLLAHIARCRATDAYRRHVAARNRSVRREWHADPGAGSSGAPLVERLASDSSCPDTRAVRDEALLQLRAAMRQLPPADRQLLELRHLSQLSVQEVAELLDTTATVVTTRHLRALRKLRELYRDSS